MKGFMNFYKLRSTVIHGGLLFISFVAGCGIAYSQCTIDDNRGFYVEDTCDYFFDNDCSVSTQNGVCQVAECVTPGCYSGYDERCTTGPNLCNLIGCRSLICAR